MGSKTGCIGSGPDQAVEDRRVEHDYVFDRLGDERLIQAYRLLVSYRRRTVRPTPAAGQCRSERRGIAVKTAAIYARVSSDRQKEEQTITSQTSALRAYAAEHGYLVPDGWVYEDEGWSGTTLVRPGLERVRDLAAQGQVDSLLVYSPDRLSRKYAYQVLLLEEFARAGVDVVFVRAPRVETPEEVLLVQFQGMIAEYEKAQISERTRRGKRHRARCGVVNVLSGAPYGYRYVRKADGVLARYEVLEPEAAVVREVFRRYTEETVADWRHYPMAHGQRRPDTNGEGAVGAQHDLGHAPQPGVSGDRLLSEDRDDAARARAGHPAAAAAQPRAGAPDLAA